MPKLNSGGIELSYDDHGSGDAVILIHGIMSDRTVLGRIAATLASRFRVINVDLRGHGKSSPGDAYDIDDFSGDITSLVQRLGLAPACFLGWSMGGEIALNVGLRHPDMVDRLVLVDTTPCLVQRPDWEAGVPPEAAQQLGAQLSTDWEGGAGAFAHLVMPEADEQTFKQYLQLVRASDRSTTLACFAGAGGADIRSRLHESPFPVRLIVGANDQVCPLAASLYLAEKLGGLCTVVPGAGHAPFLSAPRLFDAALAGALTNT